MYSIAFPNMLSSANTNLVSDKEATVSNMRLLLASWKTSLFGDPYFGTNIKRFIHELSQPADGSEVVSSAMTCP